MQIVFIIKHINYHYLITVSVQFSFFSTAKDTCILNFGQSVPCGSVVIALTILEESLSGLLVSCQCHSK